MADVRLVQDDTTTLSIQLGDSDGKIVTALIDTVTLKMVQDGEIKFSLLGEVQNTTGLVTFDLTPVETGVPGWYDLTILYGSEGYPSDAPLTLYIRHVGTSDH